MSSLQLLALAGVACLLLHKIFIAPLLNPLRDLPSPVQASAFKSFLIEPQPEQLEQWACEIPNDGLIRYRGILNKEKLLVTDPQALHQILTVRPYSFCKPPAITKIIRSLLGDGLVVVEGDVHKVSCCPMICKAVPSANRQQSQKRALQPAFKLRRVKDLYPVFWRKTGQLVRHLSAIADEQKRSHQATNIAVPINNVTLDIIGIAGFDLDFNCLADPNNQLATDYARGFAPSKDAQFYRMLAIIFPDAILNRLPLRRNQDLRAAVKAVKQCTSDVIESRRMLLKRDPAMTDGEKGDNTFGDILGVLMAEDGITDTDALVSQSMTFLGAGHDTVSAAVTCAIYELCKNPVVQSRLRDEIRHSLPFPTTSAQAALSEGIDNLPYLSVVCNEVFRMHPSVPFLQRRSLEPVNIGGRVIPKGTSFLTSIKLLNRSPSLWQSDPTVFNPDRWLDDNSGGAKERYAFMTFSQGARHCIGERFGRAEVMHLLAGLVGRFSFEFAGTGEDGKSDTLQFEHGITSRIIGGLWVEVKDHGSW